MDSATDRGLSPSKAVNKIASATWTRSETLCIIQNLQLVPPIQKLFEGHAASTIQTGEYFQILNRKERHWRQRCQTQLTNI